MGVGRGGKWMLGVAVLLAALAVYGAYDAWQAKEAAELAALEMQEFTQAAQQAEQNVQSAQERRAQIEGFAVSMENQEQMLRQLDLTIGTTKRSAEARAREVSELKEKQAKLLEKKEELEANH